LVVVRRSPELEQLVHEAQAARDGGDDAWFEERTAAGEVVQFGTAPGEVSRGYEEVHRSKIADYEQAHEAAGFKMVIGDVEAYESGRAGWAITDVRFQLTDGSYVPARDITIFVRGPDDDWLIAATFLSVVARDELITPGSPLAITATASAG
jgi:hypothetical protein